ncbi:MAG: modulator of FtsH protease [Flavobacteriales bacterium]|jgi:modulator of FtsH protease
MNTNQNYGSHQDGGTVTTSNASKVLRNTYSLLSATLLFSALMAGLSSALNLPHPGIILTLGGYFGLLFLTTKFRNSSKGLLCVFALTGFMGYTLGPIINVYLKLPGGASIVSMAMGSTALIFMALSGYALTSKKNFSYLGNFLTVGIIVAFVAAIANIFLNIPALSITVSSVFVILMSGLILYQTSEIINGGETNYIMATVTLFVSIFNLFTSLLHLLGIFNSNE